MKLKYFQVIEIINHFECTVCGSNLHNDNKVTKRSNQCRDCHNFNRMCNHWKNLDRDNRRSIAYNKTNPNTIKLIGNRYKKKQYRININFKIRSNLRTRFWSSLKKSGSFKYLGCSIDEFQKYIESKFTIGMTWNNHGVHGWHIDHIKPLSSFNLKEESEIVKAFNYMNLQPLWAIDNLKKGSKII